MNYLLFVVIFYAGRITSEVIPGYPTHEACSEAGQAIVKEFKGFSTSVEYLCLKGPAGRDLNSK